MFQSASFCSIFILIIIFYAAFINGEEKSITNPQGKSDYRDYARFLKEKIANVQSKTVHTKESVVEFYEAHRTLMLGLFMMKEEDGELNSTCSKWYDTKKDNTEFAHLDTFDKAFNNLYDKMQDFYYNFIEEKVGTPKMGAKFSQFYTDIWGQYLNDFVGFMEKKQYSVTVGAAPSIVTQFTFIGITLISAFAYYFTSF